MGSNPTLSAKAKIMPDHLQDVITYYNKTKREYKTLWRSDHGLSLHFGYYDQTTSTHDAAVSRLNEKLADRLKIGGSDRILDAGCGVGGSLIWLASKRGATGVGVNITPWQVEFARNQARKRDLESRLTFIQADFANTGLDAASFTVFWAIESTVHAADRALVAREAFRLLKPGGRLILVEYLLQDEKLSAAETQLIRTWLGGWAMPSLLTERSYRQILERTGFKHIAVEDWTEPVRPSLNRLRKFADRLTPHVQLLHRLRIINRTQIGNLMATNAQMTALDQGLWRYKVIVAEKP